jgi:flagellar hook-associated protein 3 FlgL
MTTIYGYATRSALNARTITQMRAQLDDLSRQLATGKKSDSYSGLGIDRSLSLSLRNGLSRISVYETAIQTVGVRVSLMNTSIDRIRVLGQETRSDTRMPVPFDPASDNQTPAQHLAKQRLDEILNLLNTRAGDRYLFSGRATDARATETPDRILNGDGPRAGLVQMIDERRQADLGGAGRGRLLAPAAATSTVTLEEDGVHPFGFKITAITNDFGATVTPDAGPPPSIEIDFGATNPPEGGAVRVTLTMPDGTTKNIDLTATTEAPPPAGTFLIGATVDDTATNLAAALDTEIQNAAAVDLTVASAVRAAQDFFAIDASNPPQRVDGPPFDTATALVDATTADTVFWYTGDANTDDGRDTAIARIDEEITVSYGARANEDGLRQIVENVALLAAMTFSDTDPNDRDRYYALVERVGKGMDASTGTRSVEAMQTELAGAKFAADAAKERLGDRKPLMQGMLSDIEDAMPEEVGAMLLAMNTRMQASLQTTALLNQFSLLNFI